MLTSPFGATGKARRRRYKDYAFPDGYAYRQYLDDRSILILKSPRGKGGQVLTPDTRAWIAVDAQLQKARKDKTEADVKTGVQVGTKVLSTVSDVAKAVGRRRRRRKAVEVEEEPADVPEAEPESEFPWLPVLGGGLVLVIVVAAGRRKS